ncbi:MAG: methyltransferase domain-containing protein [Hyphomicrobiales bacterium]|nr:methyltransferase domain-containing protein [Hyphomicrobiales bacterium]
MLEQEFDRFAEEYEQLHASVLTASGEGPIFFAAYKPADMRRHLAAASSRTAMTLLDFGCGVGGSLPHLRKEFPGAALIGADVSRKSLDIAEHRYPGLAKLIALSESGPMPLPEASVDAAFSACVFHHIPQTEHHRVLGDLHRVTKPGGSLFIFEHNPLNPLTRRVVEACVFDENAVLIQARVLKKRILAAGFRDAKICYRIFFPHALKWLRPLESALTWCPLGAQYFVTARKL